MVYLANREQLQKYDQLVLKHEKLTIEQLVYKAAVCLWPYVRNENNITVVCGRGNNGADALCLACMLLKKGKNVNLFLTSPLETLSQSTLFYLEEYTKFSQPVYQVRHLADIKLLKQMLKQSSLIVDGLFGYGFEGEMPSLLVAVVDTLNQSAIPILSIDIPSGLDANLGVISSHIVRASLTVSFVAYKPGFFLAESKPYLGQLRVEPLPFMAVYLQMAGISEILTLDHVKDILRPRQFYGHKFSYGSVLMNVGSDRYRGAALISCGAALKAGCGLVRLQSTEEVNAMVLTRYPEVVLNSSRVDESDAVVFGCGKGRSESTSQELVSLLQTYQGPVVIDADGISCLCDHLGLLDQTQATVILTPHIGEMTRLLGSTTISDIERETMIFASKHHVIVVLKGPHTLITDGHVCFKNVISDRAMATAGMGDCLAGIIGSLLANHYQPLEACKLGVYLHGRCGEYLSKERYSVFASEMVDSIPHIMYEVIKRN